jgi:hypothetical protein
MPSNSPRQFHETLIGYILVGVLIAVLSWFIQRTLEQRGVLTATPVRQPAPAETPASQGTALPSPPLVENATPSSSPPGTETSTSQPASADIVSTAVLPNNAPPQGSQTALEEFDTPNGAFKKEGDQWVEYPPYGPGQHSIFQEQTRDASYIYLVDPSRQKPGDSNNAMLVRLPLNGGTAQWSYQNPLQWTDFTIVRRAR